MDFNVIKMGGRSVNYLSSYIFNGYIFSVIIQYKMLSIPPFWMKYSTWSVIKGFLEQVTVTHTGQNIAKEHSGTQDVGSIPVTG